MLATHEGPLPVLVDFDTDFQLGHNETLGSGVKRVAMEQFEMAASGFFDGEEAYPSAVHEMRKAMKRVRSLLRLVRSDLGDKIYRFENESLRNTARMVAEPRAATAMVFSVNLIREIYGDYLAEGTFEDLQSRLETRRDIIHLKAMEDPHLTGRVVNNLEKAFNRYSSWPTDPDAREIYGMGIRDSYEAIGPGLHDTYARGRRDMVTAYNYPGSNNFHEWRKMAKYLRHQMEFLAPLWPEMIVGWAITLDRLGSLLGEDHDLGELLELLRDRSDLAPDPRERSLMFALVGQRRAELRVAAEILGRRIYAEKPDNLRSRFSEYWDSRQLALTTPLDTLVAY